MAGCDKSKEGEHGARSLRSLRRAARLLMIKKASAKEQSEILRLKREVMALLDRTAAEQQPAAGKKKVIKTPVPRAAIEAMISKRYNPLHGFREENLAICPQDVRESYFRRKAIDDKVIEYQQALVKQFRNKGYADDYSEVDVDTDSEVNVID
ncbi:unnamed protein product [Urochloa decumbens]|uniref:Uncharacterized protein n=1 Tax=Urochloa decumbens TaxID=240449 RepID=A0ABC8WCK3_9POAL